MVYIIAKSVHFRIDSGSGISSYLERKDFMSTELMEAFDFTADDLAYNKAEKLSPRQLARYKKAMRRGSILFFFVVLGFGAGAYFTLLPFLQGHSVSDNLGRLIGGVVLAGLALLFLVFIFQSLFQKVKPVILSAQGEAQFVSRDSSTTDAEGNTISSTTYYVVIGGHEFDVGRDKYQAFKQGHIYAIYKDAFLGVLSVEYIGPPES
jgi:hypothetical protein